MAAGHRATPYELNLTDSYEYRTHCWRFRKCSQECNRRDEFITASNEYNRNFKENLHELANLLG
ncbi:hypothetical protein SAMN05421752_1247 [Natronorubrum thiooxidans]|uniref:Uncharacterized protein n=1 Tax=Natronorubrum thiooxidans TaxID=308853 RepID=A0A1N7H4Q4_9EURY|nr:hypothetical protein SAMN05421752_1247 [Natronorubrum thiooxidans]